MAPLAFLAVQPEAVVRRTAGARSRPRAAKGSGEGEKPLLGGSWVVISRVIRRITVLITHLMGLITPLIATHEPPSRDVCFRLGIKQLNSDILTAKTLKGTRV